MQPGVDMDRLKLEVIMHANKSLVPLSRRKVLIFRCNLSARMNVDVLVKWPLFDCTVNFIENIFENT